MSNPGYCGCRRVHPAPRLYPNCTKTPNSHLPCHEYDPPYVREMPCGQHGIEHRVEDVHQASSRQRQGNCPNHRSEKYWFQKNDKGDFVKQERMQTGFALATASRGVSSGGGDYGGQGGQNQRTHQSKRHQVQTSTGTNGHDSKPRTQNASVGKALAKGKPRKF
jgi:hypothetical protein